MKLSIVICTFNRSELVEQLLEDITTQHKRMRSSEAEEVELILVDNNSFDDTNEIAYRFIENTGLSIKYFTETKLSLAAARNLAVTKCTGDLIAFLHDDVNLDDDWLRETYKIACECHEHEVGVYGGRVIPMWQDNFPSWLKLEPPRNVCQDVFRGHSYGDEEVKYPFETEFGLAEYPSGVNVLVRREVFENCGNFRTDLGPSASGGFGLLEDFEFFEYLSMVKIPMKYVPQCIVFHPVSSAHLSLHYIRRWYFKFGRASFWIAHTDRMRREPHPLIGIDPKFRKWIPQFMKLRISGVPAYLYLKIFMQFTWWCMLHLTVNIKYRNWMSMKVSETMGEIEAASLVNERHCSRKFSFKNRLVEKGVLNPQA